MALLLQVGDHRVYITSMYLVSISIRCIFDPSNDCTPIHHFISKQHDAISTACSRAWICEHVQLGECAAAGSMSEIDQCVDESCPVFATEQSCPLILMIFENPWRQCLNILSQRTSLCNMSRTMSNRIRYKHYHTLILLPLIPRTMLRNYMYRFGKI